MTTLTTIAQLEAIYGTPNAASTVKELAALNAEYRAYVEAAPFCALATVGPEGLDCSPRGEQSRPSGPTVARAQKGEAST